MPTHFTLAGEELLLHLAGAKPVWQHLEAAAQVRLTVIGTTPPSRPTGGQMPAAHAKAEILTAQLGDLRPEGRHDPVTVDGAPYGRMLSGLRGVRLAVLRVDAKFTCDVHNPTDHRERVTAHLQERGHGLDRRCVAAAASAPGRDR